MTTHTLCALILANLLCTCVSAQEISFANAETGMPVDGVYLLLPNGTVIGQADGVGSISLFENHRNLVAQRLGYVNQAVSLEAPFADTLILLTPLSYDLSTVSVAATRMATDWNAYLKDFAGKYVRQKRETAVAYNFYLQSITPGGSVRERIMTTITADYDPETGYFLSGKYARSGDFWLDVSSPFLNPQTERLVFAFAPFTPTELGGAQWNPTVRGFKKNRLRVSRLPSPADAPRRLTLLATSRKTGRAVTYEIDTVNNFLTGVSLGLGAEAGLEFLDLNGREKVSVDSLFLQFKIAPGARAPEKIQFWMRVTAGGETVEISALANPRKDDGPKELIVGPYEGRNLYEQIILSPVMDGPGDAGDNFTALADSVDARQLIRVEGALRGNVLELVSKGLVVYGEELGREKALRISPSRYLFSSSRIRGMTKERSEIHPLWVFGLDDSGRAVAGATPTVWNNRQSRFISEVVATPRQNMYQWLVFSSIELRRLELLAELKSRQFTDQTALFTLIRERYEAAVREAGEQAARWVDRHRMRADALAVNRSVSNTFGKDLSADVQRAERQIFLDDPSFQSLLTDYVYWGYHLQKEDPELARYAHEKARDFYLDLIAYQRSLPAENKIKLAGLYRGISQIYYKLGEAELHCATLKLYEENWPEAYRIDKEADTHASDCE